MDTYCTDSHEWVRVDGDTIELGLTAHAVQELTDVTFVEIQPAGTMLGAGDSLGEVESVKTTSDIYAPVPGEIVEVNEAVVANPALLNEDPWGSAWLVKLRCPDLSGVEGLTPRDDYEAKFPSE